MNPFRLSPARAVYQNVSVETSVANASPHQLIVLLFDGAIQAIGDARLSMERRDVRAKGMAIGKATRILGEGLVPALDMERGGAISLNLRNLYEYMMRRLVEANLHNRKEYLEEVLSLLNELRSAWAQIAPRQAPAAPAIQPAQNYERRAVSYGAA